MYTLTSMRMCYFHLRNRETAKIYAVQFVLYEVKSILQIFLVTQRIDSLLHKIWLSSISCMSAWPITKLTVDCQWSLDYQAKTGELLSVLSNGVYGHCTLPISGVNATRESQFNQVGHIYIWNWGSQKFIIGDDKPTTFC